MSSTTSTILLAEEHDATRAFMADNLAADGYRVLAAPDRAKALALLSTSHPDLILVDINGQTLDFVDAIRAGEGLAGRTDPDVPLIVLSRDADRLQRIRVLERGGDDVVRKPFAYPELRARIGAVLRRSALRRSAPMLRAGPLVIDLRSREVRVAGRPGRPVGEGVRPAGDARRRTDEGVHARRADAWRVGREHVRLHANVGQPRVPAAAQAVRRRSPPACDQRLGRRVPA